MIVRLKNLFILCFLATVPFAACSSPTPPATQMPPQQDSLNFELLYPTSDSKTEMGHTTRVIVRVTDELGNVIKDANVTLTFSDPKGQVIETVPATFGDGDVYRSETWTVPHKMEEGNWSLEISAIADQGVGTGRYEFPVDYSTSEIFYHRYGFWLDAPTLRGIQPMVGAERGDAENGLIRWGGIIPAQHVFPENWVEVHWRKGAFGLDSPEAVREFMLADVGDLGFTPLREIGEFKPVKFKRWDAWEAPAQGLQYYNQTKWVVFYAPEVDKTYAIATTVIQPPVGIDAHEVLLENFDIDPNIKPKGTAPEPFIPLLPQPKLLDPELAAEFTGLDQPIVLRWEPVKELAEDEYYQVAVDFNYVETNNKRWYATRDTQFTLPEELYLQPNCTIFNWRITLMRQTGEDANGNPVGEPISYSSLYRYVRWSYPPNETPFDLRCPNAQY